MHFSVQGTREWQFVQSLNQQPGSLKQVNKVIHMHTTNKYSHNITVSPLIHFIYKHAWCNKRHLDDDKCTTREQCTFRSSGQSEWHEGAYDTECLLCKDRVDFSCVWIMAQKLKKLSSRDNHLLQLCPREITVHSTGNPRGSLQCEIVQMHFSNAFKCN